MSFFPEEYEVPTSEGVYMKLKDGENIIRLLSKPVIGEEGWYKNKSVRWPYGYKITPDVYALLDTEKNGKAKYKHFVGFLVYNYSNKEIQILQLSQKGLIQSIKELAQDEDWGDPTEYDLKITRSGQGIETEYSLTPRPKKALSDDIKKALAETKLSARMLLDDDKNKENKNLLEQEAAGIAAPEEETPEDEDLLASATPDDWKSDNASL